MTDQTTLLTVSTEELARQVRFLLTLRTVFLIVAILFLVMGTILFFYLDIRTIIVERSGWIARKSIEKMERSMARNEQSFESRGRFPKDEGNAATKPLMKKKNAAVGKFIPGKSIMLVHTDEYI